MTMPARFNPRRLAFDLVCLLLLWPCAAVLGGCGDTAPAGDPAQAAADPTGVAGGADTASAAPAQPAKLDAARVMGVGLAPQGANTTPRSLLAAPATAAEGAGTGTGTGTGAGANTAGPELTAMAVGTGVDSRALQGEALRFEMDPTRVYCWTSLRNLDGPTTVTHVWRYGEHEIARHTLDIGTAKRFRTWTYQQMNESREGLWSCEVLGADGEALGAVEFEFTAATTDDPHERC